MQSNKSFLSPEEKAWSKEEEEEEASPRMPAFVMVVCITAASAGVLFGYDTNISGGVTSMDDFLLKFYPGVYEKKNNATTDNYCKFDSQLLTLFTSSLFLTSLIGSFVASSVTQKYGRKPSILLGGSFFIVGAALDGAAQNLGMLLVGRIMLGAGLGFTNQAVPLYLSEMAPANLRGTLTTMFQLASSIGSTITLLVNAAMENISPWGWRVSLSFAILPASIITISFLFLPESPSSLIERGHLDEGVCVLKKIRGRENVQDEFDDLLRAMEISKEIKSPWKNIMKKRFRPQLVMAFAIPFFQQISGINIIAFYSPILFQTFGFSANMSIYFVAMTGFVSIVATLITIFTVDKYGRRKLYFSGGCSMFILLVFIGSVLEWNLGAHNKLSNGYGISCIIAVYLFVLCFGWSCASLTWLVPSEIFPLEIRSVGQSINIGVVMFFFSLSSQTMLGMLCYFKATIFYFFAGWVLVMTIFMYLLLPETKGVPLEDIASLWKQHPFWRRYYA